ncbi:MAG: response regulator [Bacteroidetes bacterium]|jgi:two-component system LytT family response regulator|nr:response regulator [Bacteroidota bacterium]
MKKLNAIIIDDELNAIKTLEWELNNLESYVKVVQKFTKASQAIEYLTYNAQKIDLVFLDIQMPAMNGFEFLDRFKTRNFEVVFVTAYDEYAIQAIKESAVDYILKPVEAEELEKALKKIIAQSKKTQDSIGKITIPLENKLMFLNPSDIIYCKSDGNYCKIFTKDDTFLISKTLKFVEDLLPESQFYRIHQSYIVNLETIDAFNRSTNYVKLNNQKELPVSRSKRSDFLHQL